MKFAPRKTLVAILFATLTAPVLAGDVNTGYFGDVAIKGYDPVAYFTAGKPTKGSKNFATDWLGATWHFASEENRKLFNSSPISYAPQYGGHCADGIAHGGKTTNIDPEAWQIVNGKLYLNFNTDSVVEIEMNKDQLVKADANWPKLSSQ